MWAISCLLQNRFTCGAHTAQDYSVQTCSLTQANRTESVIYSHVALHTEHQACLFLSLLHPCLKFTSQAVKSLQIRPNVRLYTTVQVLQICWGLTHLVLCTLPQTPGHSSALIDALDGLPLTSLLIHLSLLYNTATISLPSLSVFHRVVDLELHDHWVLWGSTLHLEHLHQPTHPPAYPPTQRMQPAPIQLTLWACENLQVIVL